jgi:hypothetical protein
VGMPAFARCAAICAPIVPAPKTAAFSIRIMGTCPPLLQEKGRAKKQHHTE